MKFSIALAGILAHPLSTSNARHVEHGTKFLHGLSAAGTSSFKQQRLLRSLVGSRNSKNYSRPVLSRRLDNQRKDLPLQNLYSLSSEDGGKPCDLSSLDPDVGILSCGKGSLCKPHGNSFLGGTCVSTQGILKNQPQQEIFPITECDPTSADTADVGVLVCGEGQRCVPSAASDMGGFCESSLYNDADTSSRELVWLLEERGMCNSTHPNYGFYDCDCSEYDISTGRGSIACTSPELCLGLAYPGCKDLCIEKQVVYNFDNFKSPGYTKCWSTTQGAPTPQEYCSYESFDDGTCEMRLNDQLCSSCNVTQAPPTYPRYATTIYFDCTNVDGGSNGEDYFINALPIIAECYSPIENPVACDLCHGENSGINALYFETLASTRVNVDGYGTFSCGDLAVYSYLLYQISQDTCPVVAGAMLDSSCCSPICDICDDVASTNFVAMANSSEYGEVYCYYLMGLLADPTQCAEAQPLLADACCAGSAANTTSAPTDDGSSTGDVEEASTPGPTSNQVPTPPPEEADDSDGNLGGEITPPPTGENNSDKTADGASSVALSILSALMMICSAGTLMTYFAIY